MRKMHLRAAGVTLIVTLGVIVAAPNAAAAESASTATVTANRCIIIAIPV